MDVSSLEGQELTAVEFVEDYLRLRFDGPLVTFYEWPSVLLPDFSVSHGEPEYRNALCAQIGEEVETAELEEGSSLTIKLVNEVVFGLSLREEDLSGPDAGAFSETGSPTDEIEF